jgi:TetR/AcrR family fatty acid metabolism transcriptional regulator
MLRSIHFVNMDPVRGLRVGVLSRRARERRQRRADICHAAERIFAEKGYHGASIEEIARTAEYGTGTVYLYFKDKEALYVELFEEKIRGLYEHVRSAVGQDPNALEAVRRLVGAQMEFFERHRAFFRIYARERMDPQWTKGGKWNGIRKLYDAYISLLTRLIQKAQRRGLIRKGETREYAVALSGIMIQLTRDWLQHETKRPLTESVDFATELFLRGAQSKP